jgi:VWFA-related protein
MLRLGWIAGVGLFLVVALPAQEKPPLVTFGETVEVRVINVEAVVTDRQGLPVAGLQPTDFRLWVDGKEVPIRYFSEIRGGTVLDRSGTPEPTLAGLPFLTPGQPVGTSYLVFLDEYFSIARDRDRVLEALANQLGRLGPEDRMAIVAFDGARLEMLSSWSSSTRELERALRQARSRPTQGLQRLSEKRGFLIEQRDRRRFEVMREPLEGRLDVLEREYAERIEEQVSRVASAAAAALRAFAQPPGRKVLLLFSGGWPFDPVDHVVQEVGRLVHEPGIRRGNELFADLVDTANQLGYTIYAVDVPGLEAEGFVSADTGEAPAPGEGSSGFRREQNVETTLVYLARETGGEALLNGRRLQSLERAAEDTRSYYWIGFVPDWQRDDARRKIELEVRRADLKVRSRTGYRDLSRQAEMAMAVESVLLLGDGPGVQPLEIRFEAPRKASFSTVKVSFELSIPAEKLAWLPSGTGLATQLELRVAALDDRGGRSQIPVIPMRFEVQQPPAPGEKVRYRGELVLRKARQRLVLAVSDVATSSIFSKTVDFRP